MKRILIIIALVVMVIAEGVWLFKKDRKIDSYKRNTETLLSDLDTFRTKNGELVAQVNDLELSKKEFKKLMEEDAKTIESLRKRNEELDRLTKVQSEARVEIKTIVKDSIVYRDNAFETIGVIDWEDKPWAGIHAEIMKDSVYVDVNYYDSIDVAVFLEWKKFLWFKTKLKGSEVKVVSHNPYTISMDVKSVAIY